MHIYISKYLYFYEIKKMTKLQMSLYSSSDIERATQLFMDRRTSLSLPGPSCTVESMHHHCWREQDSKGERTVCSPQWHSVLSQPRNAVRECFSALVFHVDPDTGRQHRYISSVPQSTSYYKAKERAIQSTGPFVSERILFTWKYPYFNVFLNHSQNMFCVKSCKDHSLET